MSEADSNASEAPAPAPESSAEMLPSLVFGRRPHWTLIRLAFIVLTAFVLLRYMLVPIRVTGVSMYPTYKDGEINFINRWSYWQTPPRRGDVVGVRTNAYGAVFLKRIVGMPGEEFSIVDGWVFIDGKPLDEPYLHEPLAWRFRPRRLGENEYFVVGDNRSGDMRYQYYFQLPRERIVGKVLLGTNEWELEPEDEGRSEGETER